MYYHDRKEIRPRSEFQPNGCSGGLSWAWSKVVKPLAKDDLPFRHCCDEHDYEYWQGGSWADRLTADFNLFLCVRAVGHPRWAKAIYYATRIGGGRWWPFGYHWGYGHEHKSKRT